MRIISLHLDRRDRDYMLSFVGSRPLRDLDLLLCCYIVYVDNAVRMWEIQSLCDLPHHLFRSPYEKDSFKAFHPECGLDRSLADVYGQNIFDTIKHMNEWEGDIFVYDNPEAYYRFGEPSKIYIPAMSTPETGKIYITLEDISQKFFSLVDGVDPLINAPHLWNDESTEAYQQESKVIYDINLHVESEGEDIDCTFDFEDEDEKGDLMICTLRCALEDLETSIKSYNTGGPNTFILDPDECEDAYPIWHCQNTAFKKSYLETHENADCRAIADKLPYDNYYMHFFGNAEGHGNKNLRLYYQNVGFNQNFWTDYNLIINDYDLNGEWDMFRIKEDGYQDIIELWIGPEGTSIAGFNCKIPSVVITPDQEKYFQNFKEEENFCYSRDRNWLVWTTLIGEIVLDVTGLVVSATLTPVAGAALGIVTNCGIAAIEAWAININWPNHR